MCRENERRKVLVCVMKKSELLVLKSKLEILAEHLEDVDKDMERMRSYFRYRSEFLDDISEDMIVTWQDFDSMNIHYIIDRIDEIRENDE